MLYHAFHFKGFAGHPLLYTRANRFSLPRHAPGARPETE